MFISAHIPDQQTSFTELLVECANALSPHVEITDKNTVVFNADGLEMLYRTTDEMVSTISGRLAEHGLSANIAVAPNAETAILGAKHFSGVTVISEKDSSALEGLDVGGLPLSPDTKEILDSWGIHTFKEFADLPETGLAERLGSEAVELQKLAQGKTERPLRISRPSVSYEDWVELDDEVELLEPLLFVLGHSLNKLCAKLEEHGMAVGEIEVKFDLADGAEYKRELRLPFPLRKSGPLLKLVRLDLMAHPPSAAVKAAGVLISAVPPRRVQGGLYLPLAPEPEKLELTLARIRNLVGENNLGVPQLLDTHRPGAFHLQPHNLLSRDQDNNRSFPDCQIAFRYFRPALEAQVDERNDRPVSVRARGIRGKVVAAAGPWRTSGEWWGNLSWNRDEWEVALSNGTLYRLYCEQDKYWFVEGIYD